METDGKREREKEIHRDGETDRCTLVGQQFKPDSALQGGDTVLRTEQNRT